MTRQFEGDHMKARYYCGVLLAATAVACSNGASDQVDAPPQPDASQALDTASRGSTASSRDSTASGAERSRYTSLEDCDLVLSRPDEAGYSVRHCQGVGALLKVSESDGRQDLTIVVADSTEYPLHLPSTVGSGFSTLGPRAEWRFISPATSAGRPSHLIVRYSVVENSSTPDRAVAYLVVSRVSADGACVIGIVPPGTAQNEQARALADAGGACLSADNASSTGAPDAAPKRARLALEGEGLRIFLVPSGAARPLPFSTPAADAMTILNRVQGPPRAQDENVDCNASFATWGNGLTTWFTHDRFVGWSIREGSALQTASGIGTGSTRAELERVYSANVAESSLGVEFTVGGLAGLLESANPGARITHMWAGAVCIAR